MRADDPHILGCDRDRARRAGSSSICGLGITCMQHACGFVQLGVLPLAWAQASRDRGHEPKARALGVTTVPGRVREVGDK
ncbi:hypothetical protein D3C81_1976930 [compost metagenome]